MTHTVQAGDAAVEIEFEGDIAILSVMGELIGDRSSALQEAMESVLNQGYRSIIIDFYYSREQALEALGHRKEEGGAPLEVDGIRTYETEGVTVVELAGRLESASSLGKALRRLARRLIDAGRRFFVVDLKGVTHVDEATALEIIAFHTMALQEDCITLLAHLSNELNGSLEAQAFDPTQDGGPYESVDSAIDSLKTTLGL